MALGLRQRDLAGDFAVTVDTLRNWEMGRTRPIARYLPPIIRFLGYDHRPNPKTLAEKLIYFKERFGLTQKALANRLGIDESTLTGWCAGRHKPSRRSQRELKRVIVEIPAVSK